jgi:hypothetical protein
MITTFKVLRSHKLNALKIYVLEDSRYDSDIVLSKIDSKGQYFVVACIG